MTAVVVEQELFHACQVIFGDELRISRQFLEYIQMAGVKSAYRQRAKETHPDLLASQGKLAQNRGSQQFQAVQQAYKNLSVYLDAREKGFRLAVTAQPSSWQRSSSPVKKARRPTTAQADFCQKQARARQQNKESARPAFHGPKCTRTRHTHNSTQENLFVGRLPDRPLLFGHFLYYSGLVSWQSIVKALVWQRCSRPRLGDIGRRFGWLSSEDIISLLKASDGQPFGERAIADGLLTPRQVKTLLAFQRSQQRRIGEYFVGKKIFQKVRLEEVLVQYHAHNQRQNKRSRKAS